MTPHRLILILFLITILILAAGCITRLSGQNTTPTATPAASYMVTIRQPDATSAYIHMNRDIYNIGEVVEFTVTNDGSGTLNCAGDPPRFFVTFQGTNGAWVTRMGNGTPDTSKQSTLAPGASTTTYRFVTDGWDPGRYRIVQDCGVVREFILRPVPALPATPTGTISLNETVNTTTAPGNATAGSVADTTDNSMGTVPAGAPVATCASRYATGTGLLPATGRGT
jgi:hypothetical protein